MAKPTDQFIVKEIVPIKVEWDGTLFDLSFTNSALLMVITVALSVSLFWFWGRKRALVPSPGQSMAEISCSFIRGLIADNVGKEGLKYFPFIFCLFIFMAFGNLLGLVPYSFTFTSHMSTVGVISLLALLVNTVIGIKKKGWGWLYTFFPKGTPAPLAVILVPIEMVSFVSKPFSLTVRLVANMVVGHVMLKVIAGFVYGLGLFGILPIAFMCVLILFEAGIALLQAYIYTALSCIYLGDALHDH